MFGLFEDHKKKEQKEKFDKLMKQAARNNTTDNNKPFDKWRLAVDVDRGLLAQITTTAPAAAPVLLGAIDQGTSSTRFLVFWEGRILASAQVEHLQIFPAGADKVGWHEHDPMEIWTNTVRCMQAVQKALAQEQRHTQYPFVLKAIGITNQRETVLAWNKVTGLPYYNAIVWDDTRTAGIAKEIGPADLLRLKTGLPLASYFSGTKVKWLLDHVPALRKDLTALPSQVSFGTIDSWLLYQLTGTVSSASLSATTTGGRSHNTGGLHCTDVTNASRWLFMDLETLAWDQDLVGTVLAPHEARPVLHALPEILPSSHVFGTIHPQCGLDATFFGDLPIASILGDQQAALFGQAALEPGQAKNTYGTGLFLMMNTGTTAVPSTHGLLTTVAYQLGKDQPAVYALEGSVSHSGSTLQWLRDKLQILESAPASEQAAAAHNDGLYLVPAFSGLFAPHWRSDARACIVGMTASHDKSHVIRAALEATAFCTLEVFEAMQADTANVTTLKELKVDGGGSHNSLLMQFQADLLDCKVVRPVVQETTALGAALAAGWAVGVYASTEDLKATWQAQRVYCPSLKPRERAKLRREWTKAVSKSLGWVDDDKVDNEKDTHTTLHALLQRVDWRWMTTCAGAVVLGYWLGGRRARSA